VALATAAGVLINPAWRFSNSGLASAAAGCVLLHHRVFAVGRGATAIAFDFQQDFSTQKQMQNA
jgi:hypothetical protein